MVDDVSPLRYFRVGNGGGRCRYRRAQRVDDKQLVDREMDRMIVRTFMGRDVAVGREHDSERTRFGKERRGQGREDRSAGEDRGSVDGNDKGANVFAPDVADASSCGAGNDAGYVPASTDVTG